MLVVGLDLETTGLDVRHSEIIEFGAVLWDWSRGVPIQIINDLVFFEGELDPQIQAITGIQSEDLKRFGRPLDQCLARFHDLCKQAQFVIAHNGTNFDRLFLEREWESFPQYKVSLDWIDTVTDVPYPDNISTRKLTYLAAEHGFLNPFSHRAVFDVLSMLKVVSRYDVNQVIELQKSPRCKVVAQVHYENRDQAKSEGFRWDPQQRHWFLEGKECILKNRQFPFPVLWV